jgi:predicted ATPase
VACPELDELRTRLERDVAGATVKLGAFGSDSVRELAHWALPSYESDQLDRVTRRILADSAGIPLLVAALLQAVVAGLALADSTDVWPMPTRTFKDTLPGQLPDNVVAAIRVNFRRLSSNAQTVLVVAAVLGGRVDGATLGRAAGVVGTVLAGALDELEWQGWLVAEPRGYAFVARIVRDVIERDMVAEGQRRRIRDAAGGSS